MFFCQETIWKLEGIDSVVYQKFYDSCINFVWTFYHTNWNSHSLIDEEYIKDKSVERNFNMFLKLWLSWDFHVHHLTLNAQIQCIIFDDAVITTLNAVTGFSLNYFETRETYKKVFRGFQCTIIALKLEHSDNVSSRDKSKSKLSNKSKE